MFVKEIKCPYCKCPELNKKTGKLNIRGLKVFTDGRWWSHCLRCDKWF